MGYEANRFVETSARTFALVEHMADAGAIGISELARETDLSKGIVHNHVSTLREIGYVTKTEDGYRLTPQLLRLGQRARATSQLYQYGHSAVDRLSSRFETTAFLVRRDGTDAAVVHATRVPPAPAIELGDAVSLSSSLVGVAMVACESGGEWKERVDVAESGPYAVDAIAESVAERRYAAGPLTATTSREAVAAPIVDDDRRCRGGLVVVRPKEATEPDERRLVEELVTVRDRVEQRFAAQWDDERTFATEKHSWFGG